MTIVKVSYQKRSKTSKKIHFSTFWYWRFCQS